MLDVTASSAGTWGNNLQLDIDYDTSNPSSVFNLRVTEYVEQIGRMVPGRSEVFRNLSLSRFDPNDAVAMVNGQSQLVQLARNAALVFGGAGKSTSDVLTLADVVMSPGYRLAYTLNGEGPFEITIAAPTAPGATLASALTAIAGDVVAAITAKSPPGVTAAVVQPK